MNVILRSACSGLALMALLAGCKPASDASTTASSTTASTAATGKCDKVPDHPYDLPAGRFDEVSQQLAHATGCMIVYRDSTLAPMPVNAVKGQISIRQAMHQAVDGTALKIEQEQADTIQIGRR
ncbi:STN domain-containing protein [Xanthomonas sp. GPE 39]|uniref:STN domain-containing protein n=1 Tax=Xanthomonas sp. GPE 39 TaxID=1583099 RepID=UPI0005F2818C|nr:STN domain-containing protein [Xanthomonas sp. GPE 39]